MVESEIKIQENDSLEELRKSMKGVLETEIYEDDHFLRRFLKARDFNVENAEAMLRKHLEWKESHDLKNILKFKKSEVMEKYAPCVFLGYDKEGCVVRYFPIGNIDIMGLNASVKHEDFIRLIIFELEMDTLELKKQSEKHGRNIDKCVYVVDFEHFTFAQSTNKRNIYTLVSLIRIFQNNFPERLKKGFIINPSTYLTFFSNMVSPFLAKSVLAKLQLYSGDSYKEDLLKMVDADQLPAFLGGTRTDPDGNPLCKTFINRGSPIPEKYYLQKSKKTLAKAAGVVKVSLPRAAFQEVNLVVKEPDSYLEWEFETTCRDVGFGLFRKEVVDGEDTNEQIIPINRIDTEFAAETGTFKCDKVGSYVVVFDNTYSWIRAKELFYRIKVLTPKEHEAQVSKD